VTAKDAIVIEDSVAASPLPRRRHDGDRFTGGLHSGPSSAKRLKAAGADHIAETMDEVSGLLGLDA